MEVVPEVKAHNIDSDVCGDDPADYYEEFTFSAGDGNGGNAKEGS